MKTIIILLGYFSKHFLTMLCAGVRVFQGFGILWVLKLYTWSFFFTFVCRFPAYMRIYLFWIILLITKLTLFVKIFVSRNRNKFKYYQMF